MTGTDAVTVPDPTRVVIRFTAATPAAFVVADAALNVPEVVVKETFTPDPTLLPFASLMVARIALGVPPSVGMLVRLAVKSTIRAVVRSAVSVTVAFADPATADAVTVADPAAVPFRVTDA